MPKDPGMCLSESKTMYFYDKSTRECKSFMYKGCKGNPNRFMSIEDCTDTCISNDGTCHFLSSPPPQSIVWQRGTRNILQEDRTWMLSSCEQREKRRYLTRPMKKAPYTIRIIFLKWQHRGHQKCVLHQRLRTDLGRSVQVTSAIKLVGLDWFTGSQPPH